MSDKSYANRLKNLSVALQWDRGRWIWLLGIVTICALLLVSGDSIRSLLRFDRVAIEQGEWWRVWTAHWVHADAHHLALNMLGLVLVWALAARDYRAWEWVIITAGVSFGICAGLWFMDPDVEWYVGASGALHGALAASCVRHFSSRDLDRWLLSAAFVVKLYLEQHAQARGQSSFVGSLAVVVDAHWYGALAGVSMAAALQLKTVILRGKTLQ